MRDPFNRFALRYLAAVVCGLALLLLHSTAQSGLPAAFVPQCPSPWELSKLAFWPLLAAWVLTGRLGRERRTLLQDLPAAVLTPLAMTAACWGLAAAGGNGAASLAVWAVLLAAGFGSRLLPVPVNTPKPLARVHGVRIIDRLIDAVQAAGIKEVYVVRGYLSEEFDQLLRKYRRDGRRSLICSAVPSTLPHPADRRSA